MNTELMEQLNESFFKDNYKFHAIPFSQRMIEFITGLNRPRYILKNVETDEVKFKCYDISQQPNCPVFQTTNYHGNYKINKYIDKYGNILGDGEYSHYSVLALLLDDIEGYSSSMKEKLEVVKNIKPASLRSPSIAKTYSAVLKFVLEKNSKNHISDSQLSDAYINISREFVDTLNSKIKEARKLNDKCQTKTAKTKLDEILETLE